MSAKNKEKTEPSLLVEEEEYALVYNMWITNLTITVEDGGTVIFQTGRPKDPPPPPPGNP
jgi:hypothetical protein